MSVKVLVLSAALALPLAAALKAETAIPQIQPVLGPMALSGSFGFTSEEADPKDNAEDIEDQRRAASGVACAKAGVCLVAFDEGHEARLVKLTRESFEPIGGPISLAGSGETDAEGVVADTTDGANYYYVTGSHAVSRKRCEQNPAARQVFRFKIDSNGGVDGEAKSASLWKAVESSELRDRLGKCLGTRPPEKAKEKNGERGFDIEGVAVQGDRLHFGLRGPSEGTKTRIVSVDKTRLFEDDTAAEASVVAVEVGERRAIRDMQTVRDGVLLLAGPDDDTRDKDPQPWPSWRLLLWDGASSTPKPIAEFDLAGVKQRKFDGCKDATAKLEGMAVTRDEPDGWTIVVLSDGLCDGGPMWFEVKR